MSDAPKNIPASIHARLNNKAREMGKPFGEVFQYYGMERFLYRLSKTRYSDYFVLKGGLFFYGWNIPLRRPTRDMDFLSTLDNRKDLIIEVIKTAILVSVPEDGIRFEASSIAVEETREDADLKGVRVKFLGYLGRGEIPIQIDIGFSDEIISEPEPRIYPTLLTGLANPLFKQYPVESVIAEKFHSMERFAGIPSRWKDYYDVWLISNHFELEDLTLGKAIAATFKKRSSSVPTGRPVSLSANFASRYRTNWLAFLGKNELKNDEINDLSVLVEEIWRFLELPIKGMLPPGIDRHRRHWDPGRRKWLE